MPLIIACTFNVVLHVIYWSKNRSFVIMIYFVAIINMLFIPQDEYGMDQLAWGILSGVMSSFELMLQPFLPMLFKHMGKHILTTVGCFVMAINIMLVPFIESVTLQVRWW